MILVMAIYRNRLAEGSLSQERSLLSRKMSGMSDDSAPIYISFMDQQLSFYAGIENLLYLPRRSNIMYDICYLFLLLTVLFCCPPNLSTRRMLQKRRSDYVGVLLMLVACLASPCETVLPCPRLET